MVSNYDVRLQSLVKYGIMVQYKYQRLTSLKGDT